MFEFVATPHTILLYSFFETGITAHEFAYLEAIGAEHAVHDEDDDETDEAERSEDNVGIVLALDGSPAQLLFDDFSRTPPMSFGTLALFAAAMLALHLVLLLVSLLLGLKIGVDVIDTALFALFRALARAELLDVIHCAVLLLFAALTFGRVQLSLFATRLAVATNRLVAAHRPPAAPSML